MNVNKSLKYIVRLQLSISSDNVVTEFDKINVISLSHCLWERHQHKDFIHHLFCLSLTYRITGRLIGWFAYLSLKI